MMVANGSLEFEAFGSWEAVLVHVKALGFLYYPLRRNSPIRLRAMASGDRVRLSPLPGVGEPFWITSANLSSCSGVKP